MRCSRFFVHTRPYRGIKLNRLSYNPSQIFILFRPILTIGFCAFKEFGHLLLVVSQVNVRLYREVTLAVKEFIRHHEFNTRIAQRSSILQNLCHTRSVRIRHIHVQVGVILHVELCTCCEAGVKSGQFCTYGELLLLLPSQVVVTYRRDAHTSFLLISRSTGQEHPLIGINGRTSLRTIAGT